MLNIFNQASSIKNRLPGWAFNRYVLTFCVFIVWMLFFDKNGVSNQLYLKHKLQELQTEQNYYVSEIQQFKEERARLLSEREKYAREKYYMQREDEDVYIIEFVNK